MTDLASRDKRWATQSGGQGQRGRDVRTGPRDENRRLPDVSVP